MANRRREDLVIKTNLEDLKVILNNKNFGGDILVISSKENLKEYLLYFKEINSIKFLDISFYKNDNFKNYINDIYGLVIIIGSDEELFYVGNSLSQKDLSIIFIATEFINLSFLKNKFYILFVNKNLIEDTLNFNIIKLNYLLAINCISKNFKKIEVFSKLNFDEKLNSLEWVQNFVNYYQAENYFILENLIFNLIKDNSSLTKTSIIYFLKTCFLFIVNYIKELKQNIKNYKIENLKTSILIFNKNQLDLYLDIYEIILNRYYNKFNQNNIDEYINFKSDINKENMKNFFIKLFQNSPKDLFFYNFNYLI